MTIVNGYCSRSDVKTALGQTAADTVDDVAVDSKITAASRHVDDYCGPGRRFWQDTTAVARAFWPSEPNRVWVNDFATTVDLVVKVDADGDGVFETTLTRDTDFIVEPVNAAVDGEPWTSIRLIDGALTGFPCLSSGRPSVQVTTKWGWNAPVTAGVAAVAELVKTATIMQAKHLFKAPDTTFGAFQAGIDGIPRWVPALDPTARAVLEGFVRRDPRPDDEYPDA